VRKITSRRSSHIELLNLVRFHSVRTRKNYILTETELINSFELRKNDLKQYEIAFFVCELIDNLCPSGQVNGELFQLVGRFLQGGKMDDNSLMEFQSSILSSLGYWNSDRKFTDEKQVRIYIESIIEKKIKSRVIGDF